MVALKLNVILTILSSVVCRLVLCLPCKVVFMLILLICLMICNLVMRSSKKLVLVLCSFLLIYVKNLITILCSCFPSFRTLLISREPASLA